MGGTRFSPRQVLNENTDSSKKNDVNELVYKIETSSQTLRRSLWLLVGGSGGMEEGMVKEFEMDRNTLLYLKWITSKDPLVAQGTLLNVTWQPGWEGSLGENGYMCRYS